MELRTLGRTGLKVSPLCLGAMMFGGWGNTDHDDSIKIIHKALDAGINFIDTADVYSQGESEEIVGKALSSIDRSSVVLATKVHGQMGEDPLSAGNSRRWIIAEVEHSLKRLKTDYIDLYQIHRPDETTDIEETLGALSDLVHQGKIRYFGSSTFPAEQIVAAQWAAERRGYERFRTEQPPYSILVRGIERDVLPTAQAFGMGVIPWSPLAGGWLAGKFGEGKKNTSRRSARLPERYDARLTGQPAQARGREPTDRARRRGGRHPHRTGPRLRARAPRRDLPDHRAPHHEAPGVPTERHRGPTRARRSSTASTRSTPRART